MVFQRFCRHQWLGATIGINGFFESLDQTTIGFDGFRWLSTIGPMMEWLLTIVDNIINFFGVFRNGLMHWFCDSGCPKPKTKQHIPLSCAKNNETGNTSTTSHETLRKEEVGTRSGMIRFDENILYKDMFLCFMCLFVFAVWLRVQCNSNNSTSLTNVNTMIVIPNFTNILIYELLRLIPQVPKAFEERWELFRKLKKILNKLRKVEKRSGCQDCDNDRWPWFPNNLNLNGIMERDAREPCSLWPMANIATHWSRKGNLEHWTFLINDKKEGI